MKYKIVMQPNEMASGIACLATICAHYGLKDISLAVLRNIAQPEKNGIGIDNLLRVAEKLNLDASAYTCEASELYSNNITYPLVAQTRVDGMYNHYIVIFELKDGNVLIGDPANGKVEMTIEDFQKIWTNNIILLIPGENFKESKKYRKNYKYIISLLFQFRKELLISGIFTGIITGITAVSTNFYSYLLDKIVPNNDIWLLIKAMIAISGVLILNL